MFGNTPRIGVALLWATLLPGARGFPQSTGGVGAAHAAPHRQMRTSIEGQVAQLAKGLELSEAQRSAVQKILEQRQEEVLRMRRDPSISGGARIDRFRALQDRTVEKIRLVLNDDQKKKYDPLAVRRLPSAPEQRTVEDWINDTSQRPGDQR
jgi:hypothetical protein